MVIQKMERPGVCTWGGTSLFSKNSRADRIVFYVTWNTAVILRIVDCRYLPWTFTNFGTIVLVKALKCICPLNKFYSTCHFVLSNELDSLRRLIVCFRTSFTILKIGSGGRMDMHHFTLRFVIPACFPPFTLALISSVLGFFSFKKMCPAS